MTSHSSSASQNSLKPYLLTSRRDLQVCMSGSRLLWCIFPPPSYGKRFSVLSEWHCGSSDPTPVLLSLAVGSLCSSLSNWEHLSNSWTRMNIFCVSPFGAFGSSSFLSVLLLSQFGSTSDVCFIYLRRMILTNMMGMSAMSRYCWSFSSVFRNFYLILQPSADKLRNHSHKE